MLSLSRRLFKPSIGFFHPFPSPSLLLLHSLLLPPSPSPSPYLTPIYFLWHCQMLVTHKFFQEKLFGNFSWNCHFLEWQEQNEGE